jgi:hypothetical protein
MTRDREKSHYWQNVAVSNALIIQTNKTQQKEFVRYLEDMLDNENDIFSVVRVKDVLSKYKEIIGGAKSE